MYSSLDLTNFSYVIDYYYLLICSEIPMLNSKLKLN